MLSTALKDLRAYTRVTLLLLTVLAIHEGAHALVFGCFGYPVKQFVIGAGAPWISVMVGPTEFGFSPILLGAYVTAQEGVPRIPSVLAILAGPLANIGLILLHPWSPLRHVHEVVRDTPSVGFKKALAQMIGRLADQINPRVEVPITLPDGRRAIISGHMWDIKQALKKLKKEYGITDPLKNPFTDESYLDHIPFIGIVRFLRVSSVWTVSFFLGVMNLVPIPPLDGAHLIFASVADVPPSVTDMTYLLLSLGGVALLFVGLPIYGIVTLFRQRRRFAREYPTLVPR